MKPLSILIAALAFALGAPLSASAQIPAGQKAQKVHAVSLTSRAAAPKAAVATPKAKAVKMRLAQEVEPVEPVYDYASCGCS